MEAISRPRTWALFVGDVFFLGIALWLTLLVRYLRIPSEQLLLSYASAFVFLFIVWIGVFFITGLYESRSIIFARRALSVGLLVAQIVNVSIAAAFFFFVPVFGIAPKTILFIYLIISFLFVFLWRIFLFPRLGLQKGEPAIVVGEGNEINELVGALKDAPYAPTVIVSVIDPSINVVENVRKSIAKYNPQFIIADFTNPKVAAAFPEISVFLSSGTRFFDAMELYEEIFGRIPLSQLDDRWLARNVSRYAHILYDFGKRITDILGSLIVGCFALLLLPFIAIGILIDDGFPIFISQDRVGEDNKIVRIYKFRTMSGNDNGVYGSERASTLKVTRLGQFLRSWRLDELPQLWNVLEGDLSLIGPRLEFPSLVSHYESSIPYYGIRHLIKPGLSGWAQLYYHADPHHAANIEATKMKLSFDLYYLKHRSFTLDTIIAIKTIRRLLLKGNA